MRIKKLTPVLYVDAIEPSLGFWVDRLGFQKTIEVPAGDRLGFVGLERDGVELMLQTYASAAEDVPAVAELAAGSSSVIYVEVDDLNVVRSVADALGEVVPERTTFYGAREIGLRSPGGHVLIFAARNET